MGSIKTTVDKMQLVKEETEEHFFFFFYQTEREKRQMSKAQYEVKA